MFIYDFVMEIFFICDVFGMYYCFDVVFDIDLGKIVLDYQFYYDCLMGFNVCFVFVVMKCMDNLGIISIVVNGYGFLLCYNVGELLYCYCYWSEF